MVYDGAVSYKIDYVTIFQEILEGHPNHIIDSIVTAILLNWWNLPIGGASPVKGLRLQPAQQACFIVVKSQGLTALNSLNTKLDKETHLVRDPPKDKSPALPLNVPQDIPY